MRKYWFVFGLYWQEGMARRASFFMERFRALVVLVSFYYFWTAVLRDQPTIAGYDTAAMMTYLLGMNVLRGLVFASQTWEVSMEINQGRLSSYLLRPINFFLYTFFRDLAEKSINLVSSFVEVLGLIFVFKMTVNLPENPLTWLLFAVSAVLGMLLYYLLSFMVACWGFWTAESGGPRWLFELFLEFSAGAFFPIDVLPLPIQKVFAVFPSPYMLFAPLQIFLEKLNPHQIINTFLMQFLWVGIAGALVWLVWNRGLRSYAAQGA